MLAAASRHRRRYRKGYPMNRFKPLTESDMTAAQREAAAELARGPRGKLNPHGPNALLLRSPELMARTQ